MARRSRRPSLGSVRSPNSRRKTPLSIGGPTVSPKSGQPFPVGRRPSLTKREHHYRCSRLGNPAPALTGRMATVVDSAHMERLLADAEQLARSITADDEGTLAPDRGQNGAARSARAMLDHCSPKQSSSPAPAAARTGTGRWERWP
jgi:uncharacterized protein (DUF3084 family)